MKMRVIPQSEPHPLLKISCYEKDLDLKSMAFQLY